MIAVTVGHEQFVGLRIDLHIGGTMQIRGIGIALALIAVADLHDELAVLREFQQLVVGDRPQPRQAICRAGIAAQPDEALVVDGNAVLALRPLIALLRRRPSRECNCHRHRRS